MSSFIPKNLEVFQYSVLALPLAFASLPLYIYAPDFYTRNLGISIGLIGAILMIVRIFDAVQDPVIGYISDKYTAKRFVIILSGVSMLIVGMASIFYGPQFSIPVSLWFALSMILATTGFSVATINLNMIGGFWCNNSYQRTRISAWRESFALIGLLIASALPSVLQNTYSVEESFKIFFWVFAAVTITSFMMFARFMKKISVRHMIMRTNTQKGLSFLPILIGYNRHFFLICFLAHLAAAIPGVMVLFFIRDYLQVDNFSGLFLSFYFISGAVLMGVWVKFSNKVGKEKAWLTSMILAVATFIWTFFLQPGDIVAYGVICILSGMALGADLALPPSILADRISAQKVEGEATQYYALLAFIPKIAIAIAAGTSLMMLDMMGFVAGGDNSSEIMQGVVILYALVPCIIKLCAAFYLWRIYKNEGNIYEKNERMGSNGTYNIS